MTCSLYPQPWEPCHRRRRVGVTPPRKASRSRRETINMLFVTAVGVSLLSGPVSNLSRVAEGPLRRYRGRPPQSLGQSTTGEAPANIQHPTLT
jgi:hypothetical protein